MRSAAVWSETTVGVASTIISVNSAVSLLLRKSHPRPGMSPRTGILATLVWSRFCRMPPMNTVEPSAVTNSVLISRVARRGCVVPSESVLSSPRRVSFSSIVSFTSPLAPTVGVTSSSSPTFRLAYSVCGRLVPPACCVVVRRDLITGSSPPTVIFAV